SALQLRADQLRPDQLRAVQLRADQLRPDQLRAVQLRAVQFPLPTTGPNVGATLSVLDSEKLPLYQTSVPSGCVVPGGMLMTYFPVFGSTASRNARTAVLTVLPKMSF